MLLRQKGFKSKWCDVFFTGTHFIHLMDILRSLIVAVTFSSLNAVVPECPVEDDHLSLWWTYGGSSGTEVWHTEWAICGNGKNQSPIDIRPQTLLYDPHLKPLNIESVLVNGTLLNTGRDLTFVVGGPYVNITSGPLSYMYRLHQIKFHFGMQDDSGSEHTIDGKFFPGELHFMAYNAELYSNFSEAKNNPRGLAVIAVFISISNVEHLPFNLFRNRFQDVSDKHTCTEIGDIPILKLLPQTQQYMTYSGSLTQPGCKETVTWIIYNKPMYISQQQMKDLRRGPYQEWTTKSNTRPLKALNHRTVRTNISFRKPTKLCSMEVQKSYEVNPDIGH